MNSESRDFLVRKARLIKSRKEKRLWSDERQAALEAEPLEGIRLRALPTAVQGFPTPAFLRSGRAYLSRMRTGQLFQAFLKHWGGKICLKANEHLNKD